LDAKRMEWNIKEQFKYVLIEVYVVGRLRLNLEKDIVVLNKKSKPTYDKMRQDVSQPLQRYVGLKMKIRSNSVRKRSKKQLQQRLIIKTHL